MNFLFFARYPWVQWYCLLDLLGSLGAIGSVVVALHLLDNLLHLLGLSLPLGVAHLGLAAEQFVIGLSVAASEAVPEGCELAIVVVEVKVLVKSVSNGHSCC